MTNISSLFYSENPSSRGLNSVSRALASANVYSPTATFEPLNYSSLLPPSFLAKSFSSSSLINNAFSAKNAEKFRRYGINNENQSLVSYLLTQNGSNLGSVLASEAKKVATKRDTVGWCFAGVADAVDNVMTGFLHGKSAYLAADQLAKHPNFREIKVSADSLTRLPAGTIVVWNKTEANPHGHISISLGNGDEASDHIQKQINSLRGSKNFRVFFPVG